MDIEMKKKKKKEIRFEMIDTWWKNRLEDEVGCCSKNSFRLFFFLPLENFYNNFDYLQNVIRYT